MKSKTLKHVACFAVAAALISMSGCVTVGYDFINQRATVTVDPNKGYKK